MPTINPRYVACQVNRRTLSRVENDESRWMPAWMALVRTHARLWDQVEAQMRRDHGLTMARYDVLAQLNVAGGKLRLSDLASSIVLSPSGLSKLLDRMEDSGIDRKSVV